MGKLQLQALLGLLHLPLPAALRWFSVVQEHRQTALSHFCFTPREKVRVAHSQSFVPGRALGIPGE